MPKEMRDRSVSSDKDRASPLRRDSSPTPTDDEIKKWEEARCPVCIEHPHNCILLICSSHEYGCRPYMCDTSPRHSNCFEQYCKVSKRREFATPEGPGFVTVREWLASSEPTVTNFREAGRSVLANRVSDEDKEKDKPRIICPLCRGYVRKWIVVKGARSLMNSKVRSCSFETCVYSGNYTDLRKHARDVHPEAKPSEPDPAIQVSWRSFEHERDISDFVSYMRSFSDQERDEQTQSVPVPEIRLRWASSSRDNDNNRVPGSVSGVQRGVSTNDTTGGWGREGMDLVAAGTSQVQRHQRMISLLGTSRARATSDNNRISDSIVRVQRDWPASWGIVPPRSGYISLSNTSTPRPEISVRTSTSSSGDESDRILDGITGSLTPLSPPRIWEPVAPETEVGRSTTSSTGDASDRILESLTGEVTPLPLPRISEPELREPDLLETESWMQPEMNVSDDEEDEEVWRQFAARI